MALFLIKYVLKRDCFLSIYIYIYIYILFYFSVPCPPLYLVPSEPLCMGRADNQLVATRLICEVKGCNTVTICGCHGQPLLMMAIQITHKQERGTHFLSQPAQQPLMLLNSQKSGHLGQSCGKP